MTLEEIVDAKSECQLFINKAVADFERKTNFTVKIKSIEVDRAEGYGDRPPMILTTIRVEL